MSVICEVQCRQLTTSLPMGQRPAGQREQHGKRFVAVQPERASAMLLIVIQAILAGNNTNLQEP